MRRVAQLARPRNTYKPISDEFARLNIAQVSIKPEMINRAVFILDPIFAYVCQTEISVLSIHFVFRIILKVMDGILDVYVATFSFQTHFCEGQIYGPITLLFCALIQCESFDFVCTTSNLLSNQLCECINSKQIPGCSCFRKY